MRIFDQLKDKFWIRKTNYKNKWKYERDKLRFQGAFLSNSKTFVVILIYFCKSICGLFFCFVLLYSEALNSYLSCGNIKSNLFCCVCHGSKWNITYIRWEQEQFIPIATGDITKQQHNSLCCSELCPNRAVTGFIYL